MLFIGRLRSGRNIIRCRDGFSFFIWIYGYTKVKEGISGTMVDEDADTSRTAVKTYVPAYQKRIWAEHADELGMSQSEFLRTMVQAGRRGFEPASESNTTSSDTTTTDVSSLEKRIEAVLADSGPLSWDELVAELTDDIEERLDDALQDLQSANRVSYSGRSGGYTLTGEQP